MKKIFLIICILQSSLLCAQQLYFLRATIDENYHFRQAPPIQTIAYMPDQDTVLQVYKDYTNRLYPSYMQPSKIDYYPNLEMFCITIQFFKCFLFNINRPETLIEVVPPCPPGYGTPPSLMVIDNYWVYDCFNNNADEEENVFVFRGMDASLNNQFELKASDFKDLHLTGASNVQDVVLKPNDKNIYLPIVADTASRPVFSVELPQKYWVTAKTFGRYLIVNDSIQTLLALGHANPQEGEDYGRFYGALYSKKKNMWRDLELKGNSCALMAYKHWLAGAVQDQEDWNAKYFAGGRTSPGKAARDSVEAEYNFDSWVDNYGIYRPGILYLLDTDTEAYIEWHTGQGDSEILLVQDEIVYYRVFDAIYKAAIIDGKSLGEPELLVKDGQIVPQIHWAFLKKENKGQ
ncbi:MAG: hypothetical protein LBH90_03805 [Tannerella sp.]|nr:hypothetical protein [Tannerella sp.]